MQRTTSLLFHREMVVMISCCPTGLVMETWPQDYECAVGLCGNRPPRLGNLRTPEVATIAQTKKGSPNDHHPGMGSGFL